MKIFLLTDTHFFHTNIIKYQYRPSNFEELIYKNIKNTLKINDVLIHLGDICLGHDEEVNNKIISLTAHLHSRILVLGNHDNKSNTWYFNHGWNFVCKSFSAKYFGKKILFSHKPQIPEDKYDINIHGHSHGNLHRIDEYCDFFDPDYHKEVCLEHNDYKPILLKTFLEKIEQKNMTNNKTSVHSIKKKKNKYFLNKDFLSGFFIGFIIALILVDIFLTIFIF